jgi:serine/threonine protein kinase
MVSLTTNDDRDVDQVENWKRESEHESESENSKDFDDSSSQESSSSSSSASSSSASYDSPDEESLRPSVFSSGARRGVSGFVSSLRRRGGSHQQNASTVDHDNVWRTEDAKDDSSKQTRLRPRWQIPTTATVNVSKLPVWCSCFATFMLTTSVLLWILVNVLHMDMPTTKTTSTINKQHVHQDGFTIRERTKMRVGENTFNTAHHKGEGSGVGAFIQDVQDGFWSIVDFKGNAKKKKQRKGMEALRPGCFKADWQTFNFPNCNEIHEIDLALIRNRQIRNRQKATTNETVGVLNHGMWRTVWAVDPRQVTSELLALKVMKNEHAVDDRNFDRHRRDALVMERLSSSPNIVDIYGFCGNTVLTEFISETLEDVVTQDEDEDEAIASTDTYPTRKTPEGRLRLALDVARGLEAIHSIPGGPIVHADIQIQQFMVTSDGTVKLNDFNRCRFMPTGNTTGRPCPIRIPQAPGKDRAPEEYKEDELDEKMDVYSAANIFYNIMTGELPWSGWSTLETKKMVKKGVIPFIPEEFRQPGSLDMFLTNLTERAYTNDPRERISATDLVTAFQGLLANSTTIASSGQALGLP